MENAEELPICRDLSGYDVEENQNRAAPLLNFLTESLEDIKLPGMTNIAVEACTLPIIDASMQAMDNVKEHQAEIYENADKYTASTLPIEVSPEVEELDPHGFFDGSDATLATVLPANSEENYTFDNLHGSHQEQVQYPPDSVYNTKQGDSDKASSVVSVNSYVSSAHSVEASAVTREPNVEQHGPEQRQQPQRTHSPTPVVSDAVDYPLQSSNDTTLESTYAPFTTELQASLLTEPECAKIFEEEQAVVVATSAYAANEELAASDFEKDGIATLVNTAGGQAEQEVEVLADRHESTYETANDIVTPCNADTATVAATTETTTTESNRDQRLLLSAEAAYEAQAEFATTTTAAAGTMEETREVGAGDTGGICGGDLLDFDRQQGFGGEDVLNYKSDVSDAVLNEAGGDAQTTNFFEQCDEGEGGLVELELEDIEALPPVSHNLRLTQETPPLCEASLPPNMQRHHSTTPPSSSASDASVASNSMESHSSDEQPTKSLECPIRRKLQDLTRWKDVKKSGVVFTSLVVGILLLMRYPVLYLLSNLMLILITASGFVKVYAKIMSIVKARPYDDPCGKLFKANYIDTKRLEKLLSTTATIVYPVISRMQHLVLGSSLSQSAWFGFKIYLLSHVTSWLTGLTLCLWVVLIGFSWPIIYEKNRSIIDENWRLAKVTCEEARAKVWALMPKHIADKFKKD